MSENSEKGPSWSWHEITHFLSSQQEDQSESSKLEPYYSTSHELTGSCQANKTSMRVRPVRRDPARPGMNSLTFCQGNRIRDSEQEPIWT